jgi:hypothetical protein
MTTSVICELFRNREITELRSQTVHSISQRVNKQQNYESIASPMAGRIGSNVKYFFKKMPVDVYPLAAVTAAGLALGLTVLWHEHTASPDALSSIKKRPPPEYTFPGINQTKNSPSPKNLFNPSKWTPERTN